MQPKLVNVGDITALYDAVLLAVKKYSLDCVIENLPPRSAREQQSFRH